MVGLVMKEEELFRAYSSLRMLSREQRAQNVEDAIEALDRLGYSKCLVESCVTLIAKQSGRLVCRFHLRPSDGARHDQSLAQDR